MVTRVETAAIIPAYNEADRIGPVVREVDRFVDKVVVIDDGSTDGTVTVARENGAKVLTHGKNMGYLEALKTGFQKTDADILVTIDADGEMDPNYIPKLLEPIMDGDADLVIGKRKKIPRISERFLSFLARLRTDISDTGTGYRAIKKDLARKMELYGVCPCGTFVLEAEKLGARIEEIQVETRDIEKERTIAWKHFYQFWHILYRLFSP